VPHKHAENVDRDNNGIQNIISRQKKIRKKNKQDKKNKTTLKTEITYQNHNGRSASQKFEEFDHGGGRTMIVRKPRGQPRNHGIV
jgi:hypothetical protein